ncbi:MAG: APC family permease [Ktedonobacteraceae bacterium]|nr:APC family permease [Ktedonobacteraceae bacterium]
MPFRTVPPPPVQGPLQAERTPARVPSRPRRHWLLLIAFAFTVMADPISSVAYAIEAALRELGGNLALLFPTMALVVAVIAIVTINYHQLVARFPEGGGAAAAAGAALGEAWAFVPIGALIVDFVLTISISVAASTSALIAYAPLLASFRVPLALGLLCLVGGLTWFGHGGRTIFAGMTLAFLGIGIALLATGWVHAAQMGPLLPHATVPQAGGGAQILAVLLAFPVAMALATGVEAPSSAIAQLGQLDQEGRRRFGQITLWLTLFLVGGLTLGITALAVRLGIGLPPAESTQIAEIARAVGSSWLFAAFQLTTTLLLLSAASSSFQAGPGLLKALARSERAQGPAQNILPAWLGRTNRHHTPYLGLVVYLLISACVLLLSGAQDQTLVLFYAVAVFLSFLIGLLAMAHLSRGKPGSQVINLLGAVVVGFTLVTNLLRGWPLLSLVVALAIAGGLYLLWVRAGRPRGISSAVQHAEEGEGETPPAQEPERHGEEGHGAA